MSFIYDQSDVLARVYSAVQQRFADVNDLAHGWEHIDRVYRLAAYLAEQEGADHFIVCMAALLHDLGHTAQHTTDRHHADISVALAGELLQSYQVPAGQQQAILHAIVAHSFSRGIDPHTREACVVRDADRLDALGAIGIMRWAMVSAQRSTTATKTYHPDDPFAQRHQPDDYAYALDHFYKKLLHIGDTMTTETGQRLAQERTAFLRAYLDEFRQELEL